uniref:Uncharacterized protein n=1 Tax=Phytophthora ramorum TaxID=164328 RepID=H3H4X3_PHYRM
MGPEEPPRAVPLLGTGDASAAATSGTGPGPAAPIAPRPLTRLEAAAGQETPRLHDLASFRRSARASGRWIRWRTVPTWPHYVPNTGLSCRTGDASTNGAFSARMADRYDGSRRRPVPHARPLAGQGPSPAFPPVVQLPSCEVARPGRASGMVPESFVPGEALAAATTSTLAAAYGLGQFESGSSDEENVLDDTHTRPRS